MVMINENSALYKAIEEAVIIPYAQQLAQADDSSVTFSEDYIRKMQKLIRRRNKSYYPLIKTSFRRAVCIIAAAIIAGAMTVAAVKPLRDWFTGLFVNAYDTSADVGFVKGDAVIDDEDIFEYLEPQDIPEGFSVESSVREDGFFIITYTDQSGRIIDYNQSDLSCIHSIDTEGKDLEETEINGTKALVSYNDEESIICWTDSEYSYLISGDIPKSDIIRMANSLITTN